MLRLTLSKRTGESERARSEQAFHWIARRLRDGLIVIDAKGRVASMNPAAAVLTSCREREVLGKAVATVVVIPQGRNSSTLDLLVRKVLRHGVAEELPLDAIILSKKGFGKPITGTIFPVCGEGDEAAGAALLFRGLPESQWVSRVLGRTEESRGSSLENGSIGFWISNRRGKMLAASFSLAHMLGYQSPEVLLKKVPDIAQHLYVDPNHREALLRQLDQNGLVHGVELEAYRKGGSKIWLAVNKRAVRDSRGRIRNYQCVAENITARKKVVDMALRSREQLRRLVGRLHSTREQERAAIARDLHDELGQTLTALKIDLSWARKLMAEGKPFERETLVTRLEAMSQSVDFTIESMRHIMTELRPAVLDKFGLITAVKWQLQEFQRRTGIVCQSRLPAPNFLVEEGRSTALFRIFQEVLTNVARHADATKVFVRLSRSACELRLAVRDDGCGISEQEILDPSSLGLLGMRERALPFGGDVVVRGSQGHGTLVVVNMPLRTNS